MFSFLTMILVLRLGLVQNEIIDPHGVAAFAPVPAENLSADDFPKPVVPHDLPLPLYPTNPQD